MVSTTTRASAMEAIVAKAKTLEPLGWEWVPTKSGGTIRSPNGATVGLHRSGGSDTRSLNNLKAQLKQIGFPEACTELAARRRANGRKTTATARAKAAEVTAITVPGAAVAFSSASTDDTARPSASRGMITRTEQIGPERAQQLLDKAMTVTLSDGSVLHQRNVIDKEVAKFVRLIETGKWLLDPTGIAFAADGSLLNGRHRLTAVVRSGQTVPFRVHYNVPEDMFAVFDTARTRKAADTLTMAGYGNTFLLGSALRLMVSYDAWLADPDGVPHWTRWNQNKLTNQDVYEAAQLYPEMAQCLRDGTNTGKPSGLNPAAIAVFLCASQRAWPAGQEAITDFRIALQTGEDIRRGNPAYVLREWARRQALERALRHRRELHLRLLFKVFVPFAEGKTIGAMPRFDEKQPMVEPYVPARRHRQAS